MAPAFKVIYLGNFITNFEKVINYIEGQHVLNNSPV
jgi:hypothetical protein